MEGFFLENKEYYISPRVTGDKKFVDLYDSSTNGSKQQVRIANYRMCWFVLVCFATTWKFCVPAGMNFTVAVSLELWGLGFLEH